MIFQRLLYQSLLWRGIYLVSLLLLNILVSRLYGAGGSGWIFYISSVFALFILLCSFSLETAMGYYLADKRIPASQLFIISLIWVLAAGLLTWFLAGSYFQEYRERLAPGKFVQIATAFVTGNLLITFFTSLFYAERKVAVPNIILAAINVLLIATGIILYYNESSVNNALLFIDIYFFSFLAAGLLMALAFLIRRNKQEQFSLPSAATLRLLFNYSFLAFVANTISFLLFRVDYFFVEKFCDENALGNYIQVSKLTQLFFVIPGILASAIFPLTAGGQREEVNRNLPVLSRMIILVFGSGCVILAVIGKWLFPAVFGESFSMMYLPFLLMIPGLLAICLIYPVTSYYAGKNRIIENIKGSVIATVLLVVGDWLLVPRYGINGAAFVCSLSYLLYGAYMVTRFKKEYGVKLSDFFIIRKADLYHITKLLK
jgi:O-antigen/teichoic acid export membrane protein